MIYFSNILTFIGTLAVLCRGVKSATPAEWRDRSIYQVLTDRFARTDNSTTASCPLGYEGFCGGTWTGLTANLDYIQGMGFDAIWISPVVEQIDVPSRAYHGYSAKDIYSLNNNFGTADDFKALSSTLHSRGMYLMVDVAPNHFAWDGTAETTNYSTLNPFSNESYFHPICWITDESNQTEVEDCWLGTDAYPLPDVNTTESTVRDMYNTWIEYMISTYSIDGIRIDSVKNVEKDFWPGFNSAADVYVVGEASDGDVELACDYQNYMDGILGYPIYYMATEFFTNSSKSADNLVNELNYLDYKCKDTTLMAPFSENHDQPRFASYTDDMVLAKNIIAFTMLSDGIPIIYQGQEQHYNGTDDPYDREALWLSSYNTTAPLYQFIKSLNAIRQLAIAKSSSSSYLTSHSKIIHNDTNTIAIRKGSEPGGSMVLMVVNNRGQEAERYNIEVADVGFEVGVRVLDVLACGEGVVVGSGGGLNVTVLGGMPAVYYPYSLLSNTGWCGL